MIKTVIKSIVPHAFGDHQLCDSLWYGQTKDQMKDSEHYLHKGLPHNQDLHGDGLKKMLTGLFDKNDTDTVSNKLASFANSQRISGYKYSVGSKTARLNFIVEVRVTTSVWN